MQSHFLSSLHLKHGRRGWPLLCYRLLSSGSREIRSPLSHLFFRLHTTSSLSCSSQDLCSRPFPALLPFSGLTPARQCRSCSEEPRTEDRTWGVASSVPSTWVQSLPWSCWPHFLIQAKIPLAFLTTWTQCRLTCSQGLTSPSKSLFCCPALTPLSLQPVVLHGDVETPAFPLAEPRAVALTCCSSHTLPTVFLPSIWLSKTICSF